MKEIMGRFHIGDIIQFKNCGVGQDGNKAIITKIEKDKSWGIVYWGIYEGKSEEWFLDSEHNFKVDNRWSFIKIGQVAEVKEWDNKTYSENQWNEKLKKLKKKGGLTIPMM